MNELEAEKEIASLQLQLKAKEAEILNLKEKVAILEILHFGPKSEKWTKEDERQALLFNEAEDEAFRQIVEQQAAAALAKKDVAGYTRRAHRNQGRKAITALLPREETIYDLKEEEQVFGCGSRLVCIGEDASERVKIKPAEVIVLREIRKKYACKVCEGTDDERGGVVTAQGPTHLLSGSIADESLLAWIIHEKFEYALPFYRQSKRLAYLGISLPRSTLCNLSIKAAEACKPIYELLCEYIRSGPVINADETRLQVLKEPGRKAESLSWMWVFAGGPEGKEAVSFLYDESRAHDVPLQFLKNYTGYLQTDDYSAYQTAVKEIRKRREGENELKHILCWAHARRGFVKAWDATKSPAAKEAIDFIAELFKLEDLREKFSLKGFAKQRANKALQLFSRFKPWLEKHSKETLPSGALGKAIAYTLDNWEQLIRYIEDPRLKPSNNRAENAIRPFVIGRKNWLFSCTPSGAQASAIFYSLIETAKLLKLNPYEYLLYLFTQLPLTNNKDFENLLPWNLTPSQIKSG